MPNTLESNTTEQATEAAFSMREASAAELAGRAQSRDYLAAEQPTVGQAQQEVYDALQQPESEYNVKRASGLTINIVRGFRPNAITLSENRG
ncbi:MAG TPA: hypothetical protein VFT87_03950 [Candidatus Saccharimonadales bacterium]|nr:hypothetical protein [Candidatus Saccharimonadales bacterium]